MDLKAARKAAGLTQKQVADKTGVTERMYQRYEYGESIPDAYVVQMLAKALGTTVKAIFPLPQRQLREMSNTQND